MTPPVVKLKQKPKPKVVVKPKARAMVGAKPKGGGKHLFKKGNKASLGRRGGSVGRHPLNRIRPIREALKAIMAEDCSDEDKRTKARAIWEKVVESAQAGNPWAVNFIAERTEGKVATVIRQESRRRYETLGAKELDRAISEREERLSLLT